VTAEFVDAGPAPVAERLLAVAAALAVQAHQAQEGLTDNTALLAQASRAVDELRALVHDQEAAAAAPLLVKMDELAGALIDDHNARVAAAAEHGGVVGVRTGIDHLDETINGLEPGKLYILAAMPGAGKTTLALQMAATVAQYGYPALYVSLENDALDLARKTVCRFGEISYAQALKGKVAPSVWHDGVADLSKLNGRLFLSTPRATMPELAALIEQVTAQAGQPPALVVIDYLQAWVKRAATLTEEVGVREQIDRFTPALRALGERYGCAVLTISSQNRAGYANGGMAAMKESGDIEYNADVTMTLQKKAVPPLQPGCPPPPPSVNTKIELIVNKNRQGMCGLPINLTLRGDWCTIDEEDV